MKTRVKKKYMHTDIKIIKRDEQLMPQCTLHKELKGSKMGYN